jgi:large-conductance mechanosensitive channel
LLFSSFIDEIIHFLAVAGAAYFIVADKTVLATARKNSFKSRSSSVEA